MTENDEAEQDIKQTIHNILESHLELDSLRAGETANMIYESIWEHIKDYD